MCKGENYLQRDKIYVLHILCEQFLLYAKSRAIRGKSMTMDDLAQKLDELLKANDYAVFTGYRDFLKDKGGGACRDGVEMVPEDASRWHPFAVSTASVSKLMAIIACTSTV